MCQRWRWPGPSTSSWLEPPLAGPGCPRGWTEPSLLSPQVVVSVVHSPGSTETKYIKLDIQKGYIKLYCISFVPNHHHPPLPSLVGKQQMIDVLWRLGQYH